MASIAIPERQVAIPATLPSSASWAHTIDRLLRGEVAVVVVLMLVGLVSHSLNMFNYPAFSYLGDEGIYAQQAWAVLREHHLSPYTYIYDHAPAGWMLMALWMALTGGPATFGGVIPSGRALMLLLHVASIPLLYHLMRKLGCSVPVAALGTLLFIVSPLAVLNQRVVLLDNISIFWVLLSLDLLLDGWGRLSRLALSGALFGVALLTKETAVFLVPAVLFLLYQQRWPHHGRFTWGVWLVPMLMVASWYPLYAILKGELLPSSDSAMYALSEHVAANTGHVSLLAALFWQLTRTGGGPFNLDNEFYQLLRTEWLPRDAALLTLGAASTLANVIRGIRDRRAMAAALFGALPILYFARGGVVFSYYVLFALPFLCLNVAMLLEPAIMRLRRGWLMTTVTGVLVVGATIGYWAVGDFTPLYAERPSAANREAVAWIKANLPPASLIVADDSVWTDLHEADASGPAFPHVESHWKVASDPAVRDGVFGGDWQTVDYVIMTPGEDQEIFAPAGNTVALQALAHAHLVRQWSADGQPVIELWKVDKPGTTELKLLRDVSASIAARFERGGAYVAADGTVTAESQANAMLRAVWLDDRSAFERAWGWTRTNLMQPNGLLARLWLNGAVADAHSAADADTDAALALLLAGWRWNDPGLIDTGTRMTHAIWADDVAIIDGVPYLTVGDWNHDAAVVALNPSYFAPYALHVFQAADHTHDWQAVISSGYDVLFAASGSPLVSSQTDGLPPDWIGLTQEGDLIPLEMNAVETTQYGYDAARTFWRVALDLQWSGDGRARAFLEQAGFLRDQMAVRGYVSAIYAHDGTPLADTPSTVGDAGAIGALMQLDPNAAANIVANQLIGGAGRNDRDVFWGEPTDLYTQEWGWFATALYANAMPDLWGA
ncbi:MAG: hypothetical protein QOF51_14 [Chloroflexota bacterium]|jgi:endo-1,4-beta-D-glucanase Y/4-amino-4-deoxy-L-arabinose transferase-like glycosyltransferase|nr:hypothetical protein [Chloroflexota bacterium]